MENQRDLQTGAESRTRLVEEIKTSLRSGDYSRSLDQLRGAESEFPNDAEFSELETLAHDGVKRNAEANRLITESQELFAQGKSAEALQLLRQAHELDKSNSLARAILANALVEHAQSIVETDWLEAETLTNQALHLNPAHPTAKTIHSKIVDQKTNSSVEDWVARAGKLQSSGDLFKALAWVAEGLAVHPDDPKLLQIHESIQRDQAVRRRQARRGDVEELRRMEHAIDEAADIAEKQVLAERVQAMAAKYWTDGEILSIANRLLSRLGMTPEESSPSAPPGKSGAVIFHVPRPSAPESSRPESSRPESSSPASREDVREVPPSQTPPTPVAASPAPPKNVPASTVQSSELPAGNALSSKVPPSEVRPRTLPPKIAPLHLDLTTPRPAATAPAEEVSEAPDKISALPPRPPAGARSTTLIFISAAAIILVAATFFLTRKHYAPSVAKTQSEAATVPPPEVPAPTSASPTNAVPVPAEPAPAASARSGSELPASTLPTSAGAAAGKVTPADQPMDNQSPAAPARSLGTLLVITGQDGARVFLNGSLQSQLTQAGQLRLTNLEFKDYVVQVSKSGFQDPPQQTVRIRNGEQARLIFNLQPQQLLPQTLQSQPRPASLAIQGGVPGTSVLLDQSLVGMVQADGTLSISTLNPGDHTVELRKERFESRQFQKHFVAGETVSLTPADTALAAAPGGLTISFAPPNATVALVKGDLLKMVSSGVALNLPSGTYTLTARTAERFTRTATLEVTAGQSRTLNLSLAPSGMSMWDDPGAWKQERDSFVRKGGDFVLYEAAPAAGTFVFSAMQTKGHLLQWVLNYTDPRNYVLCQMDDENFYRSVIRNGQKTSEVKVPDKGEKKSFRSLQIRVTATELVQQIRHGEHSTVLDRWTQPSGNLSLGKFGFYIPGDDQMAVSNFAYYPDLNIH